jgi:hypothetical protein
MVDTCEIASDPSPDLGVTETMGDPVAQFIQSLTPPILDGPRPDPLIDLLVRDHFSPLPAPGRGYLKIHTGRTVDEVRRPTLRAVPCTAWSANTFGL